MAGFETIQSLVLPLVAFHAIHALKRDWRDLPRIPNDPAVKVNAKILAALALASWVAMNFAPVVYYSLECVSHFGAAL